MANFTRSKMAETTQNAPNTLELNFEIKQYNSTKTLKKQYYELSDNSWYELLCFTIVQSQSWNNVHNLLEVLRKNGKLSIIIKNGNFWLPCTDAPVDVL